VSGAVSCVVGGILATLVFRDALPPRLARGPWAFVGGVLVAVLLGLLFSSPALAAEGDASAIGTISVWQLLGGAALQVVVAVVATRIGAGQHDAVARVERLEKRLNETREEFARRAELAELRAEIRKDLDDQREQLSEVVRQNARILALLEGPTR